MKKCDKTTSIEAANFVRSVYLLIIIHTLLLKLHSTSLYFAQLHFTTPVDTVLLPI